LYAEIEKKQNKSSAIFFCRNNIIQLLFFVFVEFTYQKEVTMLGNKVMTEICDGVMKKVDK